MSWSLDGALAYVRAMGVTHESEVALATIIADGGCVLFAPREDAPSFPDFWRRADTAEGE